AGVARQHPRQAPLAIHGRREHPRQPVLPARADGRLGPARTQLRARLPSGARLQDRSGAADARHGLPLAGTIGRCGAAPRPAVADVRVLHLRRVQDAGPRAALPLGGSHRFMIVTCRPEAQDDETFVRRLVVETIAGELGARTWPEPMRSQLIDLQYRTRRSVARSTPGVITSQILVADGEDAGWLLTADLDDEIRIVEIMVLPARRNQGAGSAAIDAIL